MNPGPAKDEENGDHACGAPPKSKREVTVQCRVSCWRFTLTLALTLAPVHGGERKPFKPGATDKCPVCGMFVAKYPDWVAEIIFKDGSAVYFDGCKDMFKYYFNLKRYNP